VRNREVGGWRISDDKSAKALRPDENLDNVYGAPTFEPMRSLVISVMKKEVGAMGGDAKILGLQRALALANTKPMSGIWETFAGLWRKWRPSVNTRAEAGAAGERAAEAHLKAAGLRVLARNWRNPADAREELDLVCEDPAGRGDAEPVLVFVEVKARAAGARVGGYQAVDRRKKTVLLRACTAYLKSLRPPARHYRFDIIEVAHGADPEGVAAFHAQKLDPRLASLRAGRRVWHYRNVTLFPARSSHSHG